MSSWETVRLGDILTESKIESSVPSIEKRIRVLLNAKGVIKRPIKKETKGATKYFIRKNGQFIYGKQNIHKGAFGIVPDTLNGFESTSDLPAFDVDDSCLPLWIDYYLKQGDFYLSLLSIARGAATKRVQPKELLELKIPLPSITEQMKIIEGFENIETEDRELKQELTYQQTLLKKLHQQILQEAIEGKLTADWREQNPDVEPASELLARIKAEKEQLIKDKKIRKQKALPLITDEEKPFDLPDGWEWCRLEELSNAIHYGATKSAKHSKVGVRLLRITDIQNNDVDWDSVPGCDYTDNDLITYGLSDNDILIARTGGTIGKSYLVQNMSVESLFASYLIRVIPHADTYVKYIKLFIETPCYWGQLYEAAWGAGQPNVNGSKLKVLMTPLPPLAEQKAIVSKVEKLLAICDQLEAQITNNQTHADQLMQAVLKEAFQQSPSGS